MHVQYITDLLKCALVIILSQCERVLLLSLSLALSLSLFVLLHLMIAANKRELLILTDLSLPVQRSSWAHFVCLTRRSAG